MAALSPAAGKWPTALEEKEAGGIPHMKIPPSDPTLTMIRRSGEIRTDKTLPLCPVPMLVVKPSS